MFLIKVVVSYVVYVVCMTSMYSLQSKLSLSEGFCFVLFKDNLFFFLELFSSSSSSSNASFVHGFGGCVTLVDLVINRSLDI